MLFFSWLNNVIFFAVSGKPFVGFATSAQGLPHQPNLSKKVKNGQGAKAPTVGSKGVRWEWESASAGGWLFLGDFFSFFFLKKIQGQVVKMSNRDFLIEG